MRHFEPQDKLVRTQGALSTELDQELVLMSIDAGAYYGLAGTARVVWEKLETPQTFATLIQGLAAEYSIAPEACAADMQRFLSSMEDEGLLRVG